MPINESLPIALVDGRLVTTGPIPLGNYTSVRFRRLATSAIEASSTTPFVVAEATAAALKGFQVGGDSQSTGTSTGAPNTDSYRAVLKLELLDPAVWDVNAVVTTPNQLAQDGQTAQGFLASVCNPPPYNPTGPPLGIGYVKPGAYNEWVINLGTNDRGAPEDQYPALYAQFEEIATKLKSAPFNVDSLIIVVPGDTSLAADAPDSYFLDSKFGHWRQYFLDNYQAMGYDKILDLWPTPFGRNRPNQPEITVGDQLHYNSYAHRGIANLLLPLVD